MHSAVHLTTGSTATGSTAVQAMINHVHTRIDQNDPTLFLDWTTLRPILAKEIKELIQAHQGKNLEVTIDEAGDVVYVASYGLRFSSELQKELALAAIGRSTAWNQLHYFSPASEAIPLSIGNISQLQTFSRRGGRNL